MKKKRFPHLITLLFGEQINLVTKLFHQALTTVHDWPGFVTMAALQWTWASRASVSAQMATRENTARQVRALITKCLVTSHSYILLYFT